MVEGNFEVDDDPNRRVNQDMRYCEHIRLAANEEVNGDNTIESLLVDLNDSFTDHLGYMVLDWNYIELWEKNGDDGDFVEYYRGTVVNQCFLCYTSSPCTKFLKVLVERRDEDNWMMQLCEGCFHPENFPCMRCYHT